jgi:hypothetical protein
MRGAVELHAAVGAKEMEPTRWITAHFFWWRHLAVIDDLRCVDVVAHDFTLTTKSAATIPVTRRSKIGEHRSVEILNVSDAGQSQGDAHLFADNPQKMVDALFPASSHGVGPRPANKTGPRPEGQRLDDVEAAANSSVHQDFAPATDRVDNGR